MEGDLVEKDSSLPQDLPDPIPIGGFERGSSSQSSEKPQRKSKKEIDAAYRKRKREEKECMEADIKTLKENNCRLEEQTILLRNDLKETKNELKETRDGYIRSESTLKIQNDRVDEIQKKLDDQGKKHEEEMNDLREERNALRARNDEISALLKQLVCSECSLEETIARGGPCAKCIICQKSRL